MVINHLHPLGAHPPSGVDVGDGFRNGRVARMASGTRKGGKSPDFLGAIWSYPQPWAPQTYIVGGFYGK